MSTSYKPLPDCLTIKESPIHGLGVFATKDILKNDEFAICNTHLQLIRSREKLSFNPTYLERLEAGGYINHSKKPNVILKYTLIPYPHEHLNWKYLGIFPIRDIKAGEEILMDYTQGFGLMCGYKDEEWLK
jgi:SET domain-containing protein